MRIDRRVNLGKTVLAFGLLLIAAAISCKSTKQNLNKPVETPAQPSPTPVSQSPFDVVDSKLIEKLSPFDHNRKEHKTRTQDCAYCHRRPDNSPTPIFPGHSACLECHSKDFNTKTSQVCVVCHKTPLDAQASRISFPGRLAQFGIKSFSHQTHSNPEKMKDQMDASKMPGGVPECNVCHSFEGDNVRANFPHHPQCYDCHSHEPGQKFGDCGVCHARREESLQSPGIGSAFALYNFRHGPHINKAKCDRCHKTTELPENTPRPDIASISTARGQKHHSTCWTCHVQAKESVCTKCHVGSLPF